ncbi:MAG: hypothetical protein HY074_14900 [Deltaproteobacteria bacterium]|nr:hypothetical protein [Deltaproteobacteria bacterium]
MFYKICATLIVAAGIAPLAGVASMISRPGQPIRATNPLERLLSDSRKYVHPKLRGLPFLAVESGAVGAPAIYETLAFDRATKLCDVFGYQTLDAYELDWTTQDGKAYYYHGKDLDILKQSKPNTQAVDFRWARFSTISCSLPKPMGPVFSLMLPETDPSVETEKVPAKTTSAVPGDLGKTAQDKPTEKQPAE